MPLCAGSVSCTKSRSSHLLHLFHMDQMLEQARREAKGWAIAGIISAAAGLSVWAFNPPSLPAWFAGGAFVIVGFYLVRTSRPFLAAVEQLLRTEQPCDMHLTIRGTAQQIDTLLCRIAIPAQRGRRPMGFVYTLAISPGSR